jgi:hypothetical protein
MMRNGDEASGELVSGESIIGKSESHPTSKGQWLTANSQKLIANRQPPNQ